VARRRPAAHRRRGRRGLALQFRIVLRGLGEKEIRGGYWTSLGVWLNFLLACVALVLAMHFVTSG